MPDVLPVTHIERRPAESLWDLRHDAHDRPERWHAVTAEVLFQHLVAYVEQAEERGGPMSREADADRLIAWWTYER